MYKHELKIAVKAATIAGNHLKNAINKQVDCFDGKDIKLAADKNSEAIIIDILEKTGISILSEEAGFINHAKGAYWIVDPLDGTFNYYKGLLELSCVSIALCIDDEPVFGVINRFQVGEMFTGMVKDKAYLNNMLVVPSKEKALKNAVLATGFPVKRDYSDEALKRFIFRVQQFKKIRMLGAAALMGVFVSCGRIDAYLEEDIMFWDVAAAVSIAKAAGCSIVLNRHEDNRCLCGIFSTKALLEDYNAQSI